MTEDLAQLLKKATAGDEPAIDKLVVLFKEPPISLDEQEQIHLYIKQAARQSHHAIYLRGLFYKYGYGVKQDFYMSFLLMREAAAKGNSKATYEIGYHYLEGMGVEKNEENALKWLEIAAGSPHYVPEAMYELGRIYEQGLGEEQHMGKARTWYEQAAKKGHQGAKIKLVDLTNLNG